MLKGNIWIEYWLIQSNGEGKFGPYDTELDAYKVVEVEELHDYELKQFLSFIPF